MRVRCADVARFVCENLDEGLRSARCKAIQSHIASCDACREYLTSVKKTVQLYRASPSPRLPDGVKSDLFRTLRRHGILTPGSRSQIKARHKR